MQLCLSLNKAENTLRPGLLSLAAAVALGQSLHLTEPQFPQLSVPGGSWYPGRTNNLGLKEGVSLLLCLSMGYCGEGGGGLWQAMLSLLEGAVSSSSRAG